MNVAAESLAPLKIATSELYEDELRKVLNAALTDIELVTKDPRLILVIAVIRKIVCSEACICR